MLHTRLRPHCKDFLEKIAKLYELHVFTFGSRLYAHTIAGTHTHSLIIMPALNHYIICFTVSNGKSIKNATTTKKDINAKSVSAQTLNAR